MRARISISMLASACSRRATRGCVDWMRRASSFCVMRRARRLSRTRAASRTRISGETETSFNNVTTTNAGGLLTQTSNLGTHRDSYVSSVWELGLKVRRRLTSNTSLSLGYSWFLLSHVERAGEQIDLGVNVTQIPPGNLVGAARPAFPGEKSSFWTQGLTCGIEAKF